MLERKNWQAAIFATEQSNAIDPGRAQVWKMLAIALHETKQHARACAAVEQGLRLAPGSGELLRLHAALHRIVPA